MIWWILLTMASAEKCSKVELKTAMCWTACRRDGYETGSYESKKDRCMCSNFEKLEDITREAIKIQGGFPRNDDY